jgi:alpha-beta hydrolase superfamily lysophospholipase
MPERCDTKHMALRDGREMIPVSVTTPVGGPGGWEAVSQSDTVVLGNGLGCCRRVLAPLAHTIAAAGFAVVTYDNPLYCYNLDDLTARFDHVVRRVGQEGPSTLALYSQSSIAAARAGAALVADAGVQRFLFIAPAGMAPREDIPPEFASVGWNTILHATNLMLHEAVTIPGRVHHHPAAREAAGYIVANNILHATRHPQAFKGEAHATFRADERQRVVALAGKVPVGVMAGTADTYFPHPAVQIALNSAGYPHPVDQYTGNHIDPVFSAQTADAVVAFMNDIPHPAVLEMVPEA